MSELEKQEIISRVNAMSREEKVLIASAIPVDICQNRVAAEIERLLTLEKESEISLLEKTRRNKRWQILM